jgi:hypothetical protein
MLVEMSGNIQIILYFEMLCDTASHILFVSLLYRYVTGIAGMQTLDT